MQLKLVSVNIQLQYACPNCRFVFMFDYDDFLFKKSITCRHCGKQFEANKPKIDIENKTQVNISNVKKKLLALGWDEEQSILMLRLAVKEVGTTISEETLFKAAIANG